MSVHLPILAIKAKGSNELLKDKINGYFFSVKKNNFYTKILNIKNKKLNQRKLINFNKEYTKKFDLELATTKLIREYKKLIF
jgi:glycosyltransferase involved in cell wall biosynthesis